MLATGKLARKNLYEMLAERLQEAVAANAFASGRLPTEPELARAHGVSVITVRKALERLARAGVIVRRQGSGTFVNARHAALRIPRKRTRLLCYVSGTGTESYTGNFFQRLLVAAQLAAERAGHSLVLSLSHGGTLPLPLRSHRADGTLLAGTYHAPGAAGRTPERSAAENDAFVRILADAGTPLVTLSNHHENPQAHRINPDYDAGLAWALACLAERGHRRIAFCGGPLYWPPYAERLAAFQRQARRLDLNLGEELVCRYPAHAYLNPPAVIQGVRQFLSERRPTALCVASGTARLVLDGVAAAGLRVPQDVSIVALTDGLPAAPDAAPPPDPDEEVPTGLAVVEVPVVELAETAVRRLLELLEGRSFSAEQRWVSVPMRFLLGASVAAVRA